MKKFLKIVAVLLFLGVVAFVAWYFLFPVQERNIYHFVPDDAIYVLESQEPVDDWKEFAESDIWQFLKTHEYFNEINESADYLDSLVHSNETLLDLVGERQVLISAHKDSPDDYDFLFLVDLKQGAKVADLLTGILTKGGIGMNDVTIADHKMLEIPDPEYGSLYMGFVDNIFAGSYSKKILENSLKQYPNPHFSQSGFRAEDESILASTDPKFTELDKSIRRMSSGPYQVYLNFAALEGFLGIYMDEIPETGTDILDVMEYGGFDLEISDTEADLEGIIQTKDSSEHLLNAMKSIDGSKIGVANILPTNTSFFTSINFEKFDDFHRVIDTDMRQDEKAYDDYQKNIKTVEKLLGINFEEHFLSWIGDEIAIATIPVDGPKKQSYLAAFRSRDMPYAQNKLDFVTKRIKRRTPVKFKEELYRNYSINYLEMKGFFKLFFGKLFDKFEKPHFTYVDDYVLFSNDTETLHKIIDGYEDKQTLNKESDFYRFYDNFDRKSNYFVYLNTKRFYPSLMEFADSETKRDLRNNREYIEAFQQLGIQLKSDGDVYEAKVHVQFKKPENAPG